MPRLTAAAIASGTLAGSEQPFITVGSGALLRPWKLTDAEAVVQAFTDPDIQRWHVRSAESEDEVRGWITTWQSGWAAETEANWALADSRTDKLLGRMSLKGIDLHDGTAGRVGECGGPGRRGARGPLHGPVQLGGTEAWRHPGADQPLGPAA